MKKSEERRRNSRGIGYLMLLSIACAFASAFAWTLHICNRAIDPYAVSPFDLFNVVFDLIVAVVCGPVIAALAILIRTLCRYARIHVFSNRGLFIVILVFYAATTAYLLSLPAELGSCRFDW